MYDTDSELIPALINKEDSAYRFAVKNYQGPMLYLARSIIGTKLADEVVQEAWFSVLKNLPKFQQKSRLKTWILTIVANEAKGRLRKEKRQVSLDAADDDSRFDQNGHWKLPFAQWHAESPEALLASEELGDCLQKQIGALPALQGATLNLKERQGYSLAEICNILDVTESNVRVLLHRARSRTFRAIEHFQETGEC